MKSHRILYGIIAACLSLLVSCKEELDMNILQKPMYDGVVFDEVSVDDAWQVTIIQDNEKTGVMLEYSAFLEPYIKALNAGSRFELGFTRRLNLPFNTVMSATVYVPALKKLSLDDASSVNLEGEFPGQALEVVMDNAALLRGGSFAGDASLRLDNASTIVEFAVDGDHVQLQLDNASVFKGNLRAATLLQLEEDHASRATLYEGDSPKATLRLNNTSFLNMVPVRVEEMEAELDNASEASVNTVHQLNGTVNNVSKLFYEGTPALMVECDDTSLCQPL